MVKIGASALTFAAAHVAVASAQDDCKPLDGSSPLGQLVAQVAPGMNLTGLASQLPESLSKCVGSFSMNDVVQLGGIATNDQCLGLLKDNATAPLLSFVGNPAAAIAKGDDEANAFCTTVGNLNGCLTKGDNAALPLLITAIAGQPCCSGIKSMVDLALTTEKGDAASAAVEKVITGLLFDVENVFCAKRAGYGDDSSKQMRCMSLMAKPFFGSTKDTQNLLKIPNNQALDAYEGKDFTNADNSSVSFPAAYDSCSWPMDTLMTGLKDLPLVNLLGASNFFADGQCAPADAIQEKAGAIPLIGGLAKKVFTEGCYHFANGFSADAKFQNVATLTNGATSDGSSSGSSDGSKKDNAGVLTSVSATVVLVAVAQFFL